MKKQKTELKKLRIDKETMLPLSSRQVEEVAVAGTRTIVLHFTNTTTTTRTTNTQFIHV
jgi:hypothetical protein